MSAVFLMINIDLFGYFLRNKFSLYWRIYDTMTALIAEDIIQYHYGLEIFDNNYTTSEGILLAFIQCLFVAIIGTVFISMIEAYLNVPHCVKILVVLMGISFWIRFGTFHLIGENIQSLKVNLTINGDNYFIELNDLIITKSFDATVWFCFQLWTICRYKSKLTVYDTKREWIVASD